MKVTWTLVAAAVALTLAAVSAQTIDMVLADDTILASGALPGVSHFAILLAVGESSQRGPKKVEGA